jgi:hypothetical protein
LTSRIWSELTSGSAAFTRALLRSARVSLLARGATFPA